MISDLFGYGATVEAEQKRLLSREHSFVVDMARGHFKSRPKEPVWQWADREVWLGAKMAAKSGRYRSRFTPWAREPMDQIRNPDVKEVDFMKSSRTGITEAFLCDVRWMPKHRPGNVLYAINERNLARQVMKRRIIPSLQATCPGAFSDDKDDTTLSVISLKNMDIVVSGSGSSGPFMEMWYALIILDELENHLQTQETTTEERAESRQADVEDGLIVKISKPEHAGGIIDLGFIRGTQKRYWVPCPRCSNGDVKKALLNPQAERFMLLDRNGAVASHCRGNDGTWDLKRVIADTYRVCPYCHGRIDEWEKEDMVNAAVWVPTPDKDRRRGPDGKHVPPEPGVESYQISDWYSLHSRLSTGHMMAKYLMATEIQPTESRKKFFCCNHDGWPWDVTDYKVDESSLDALKGGRVEQVETVAADGTKTVRTVVLGVKYHLAYKMGESKNATRLPFRPSILSLHVDKQKFLLKSWVVAWMRNGDRYLIDVQDWRDEDTMFSELAKRPYWIAKAYREDPNVDEPMYVRAGRIDCGYRPSDVYKACLKANREHGFQVWPVRGEGDEEKQGGKKLLRFTKDYVDGAEITLRMFWDHEVKNNFYISRIQQRLSPRLWFPDDLPRRCYEELTSEKFNSTTKKWEHPDGAPPNDDGDIGKQTELFWEEEGAAIRELPCAYPRQIDSASVA